MTLPAWVSPALAEEASKARERLLAHLVTGEVAWPRGCATVTRQVMALRRLRRLAEPLGLRLRLGYVLMPVGDDRLSSYRWLRRLIVTYDDHDYDQLTGLRLLQGGDDCHVPLTTIEHARLRSDRDPIRRLVHRRAAKSTGEDLEAWKQLLDRAETYRAGLQHS